MASTEESKRILVVDDEPIILLALFHALASRGHEVVAANSLEAAKEALERGTFGLVITDMCLSRMSRREGLELLSYIKKRGLQTEVIIMTAHLSDELREKARELGANHSYEKPFDIDDILERVRSVVGAAQG